MNINDYIEFATIVNKYIRRKGDMLVLENISSKKNIKDFNKINWFMEKYLNERNNK